jgi:hypothetical protein
MVALGTRNARAISVVVGPPTERSVRAIAEAGVRAGWQHMNRTVRVSLWLARSSASAGGADRREAVRLPGLLGGAALVLGAPAPSS